MYKPRGMVQAPLLARAAKGCGTDPWGGLNPSDMSISTRCARGRFPLRLQVLQAELDAAAQRADAAAASHESELAAVVAERDEAASQLAERAAELQVGCRCGHVQGQLGTHAPMKPDRSSTPYRATRVPVPVQVPFFTSIRGSENTHQKKN